MLKAKHYAEGKEHKEKKELTKEQYLVRLLHPLASSLYVDDESVYGKH